MLRGRGIFVLSYTPLHKNNPEELRPVALDDVSFAKAMYMQLCEVAGLHIAPSTVFVFSNSSLCGEVVLITGLFSAQTHTRACEVRFTKTPASFVLPAPPPKASSRLPATSLWSGHIEHLNNEARFELSPSTSSSGNVDAAKMISHEFSCRSQGIVSS